MEGELLTRVLVFISVIVAVKIFSKNSSIKKNKEVDRKKTLERMKKIKAKSPGIVLSLLFILGLVIEIFVPYVGLSLIAIVFLYSIILAIKKSKKEY